MALETGEWVGDFVITNPTNGDAKKYGDDHLRLIKEWVQNSFAGWDGLILAYATEAEGATVNDYVLTVTPAPSALTNGVVVFIATHTNTGAATLQINALAAKALETLESTALVAGNITNGDICAAFYNGTEFRIISANGRALLTGGVYTGSHDFTGATPTVPTAALEDSTTKAASTAFAMTMQSPAFTGIPTAPTAAFGASGTQLATLDFANAVGSNAALPGQTAKDDMVLTTDGTAADWLSYLKSTVMRWADGTDITKLMAWDLSGFTTGTTRTLTVRDENITIVGATATDALKIYDYTDATKKAVFQASGISTATTRTITLANNDSILDTPGWRLLSVVTASNSATVDIETTFNSTYDKYVIEVDGLTVQTNNTDLQCRLKIGGSYLSTNEYNYLTIRHGTAGTPITGAAQIQMVTGIGNDAADSTHFRLTLANPASTAFSKNIHFEGVTHVSTAVLFTGGAGTISSAVAALTGVRFLMSSGNIVAGSFKLYGLRKAI